MHATCSPHHSHTSISTTRAQGQLWVSMRTVFARQPSATKIGTPFQLNYKQISYFLRNFWAISSNACIWLTFKWPLCTKFLSENDLLRFSVKLQTTKHGHSGANGTRKSSSAQYGKDRVIWLVNVGSTRSFFWIHYYELNRVTCVQVGIIYFWLERTFRPTDLNLMARQKEKRKKKIIMFKWVTRTQTFISKL